MEKDKEKAKANETSLKSEAPLEWLEPLKPGEQFVGGGLKKSSSEAENE